MSQETTTADLIGDLALDRANQLLHGLGFRVEPAVTPAGAPCLRSATGGLAFELHAGSPAPSGAERFLDFRLIAALQVDGELPWQVLNEWNATRRYARMHRSGDLLVIVQDVSVAGGVTAGFVSTQIMLWDRLLQDLPGFLRAAVAALATQPASAPASAA